jgi:hypothetical protein
MRTACTVHMLKIKALPDAAVERCVFKGNRRISTEYIYASLPDMDVPGKIIHGKLENVTGRYYIIGYFACQAIFEKIFHKNQMI